VIEILRQQFVATQLLARNVGDDLFAGRLDHEIALMPILHAQQLGAILLETAALLPQLGGLHDRHQQLDGAGAVHLFADDGLDLADNAQTHRHVVVNASGQPLDQARAQHQLVAHDLGVGRCLLEGRDEELGSFHGTRACVCVDQRGPQRRAVPTGARMRETEGSRAAPGRCNNQISQ
jgi:hypothetical protein